MSRALCALLLGSAACTELLGSTAGDGAPPDAAGCGAPVRAASLLHDTAYAATLGVDGALVDGAGRTYVYGAWYACRSPTSSYDAYVMRFRPDGTLDESFAERGRFCDGLNEGGDGHSAGINAMAIDARGRLVFAGQTGNTERDLSGYLLRLDPNGRPDPSFGEGGVRRHVLPGGVPAVFYAVLADGDGLLLAGGDVNAFNPTTLGFLWRLREDGSPDPGFARGAPVVDSQSGAFVALARVPAGYAVAGQSRATSRARVAVFDRAGSLVTTFGQGGAASATAPIIPRWLHIDAAGRIAVGGAAVDRWLLRVARFDRDGRVDTGFGEDGLAGEDSLTVDPGPSRGVCTQACDGRITCAGRDRGSGVTLVRWRADGRHEPSFGTGGYLSLPGPREPRAAAIDPRDGSTLLVTRSGRDGAIAVQLWRVPP